MGIAVAHAEGPADRPASYLSHSNEHSTGAAIVELTRYADEKEMHVRQRHGRANKGCANCARKRRALPDAIARGRFAVTVTESTVLHAVSELRMQPTQKPETEVLLAVERHFCRLELVGCRCHTVAQHLAGGSALL